MASRTLTNVPHCLRNTKRKKDIPSCQTFHYGGGSSVPCTIGVNAKAIEPDEEKARKILMNTLKAKLTVPEHDRVEEPGAAAAKEMQCEAAYVFVHDLQPLDYSLPCVVISVVPHLHDKANDPHAIGTISLLPEAAFDIMRRIDEKYDESGFLGICSKGEPASFFRKEDVVKVIVSLVTLSFILKLDVQDLTFPRIGASGLEQLFGVVRLGTRGNRQHFPVSARIHSSQLSTRFAGGFGRKIGRKHSRNTAGPVKFPIGEQSCRPDIVLGGRIPIGKFMAIGHHQRIVQTCRAATEVTPVKFYWSSAHLNVMAMLTL
jgi:hypothetical protein